MGLSFHNDVVRWPHQNRHYRPSLLFPSATFFHSYMTLFRNFE